MITSINKQDELRSIQRRSMDSFKMFLYHAQRWNNYPVLTEDVLRLIHKYVIPERIGHIWCESCEKPVLSIKNDTYIMEACYKCIDNSFYCNECGM